MKYGSDTMIILGDKIPISFDDCGNKCLVLDITAQHAIDYDNLNPTNTYIVTSKGITDYLKLISQGYLNIMWNISPSHVTERFLRVFLNTSYNDNCMITRAKSVLELYAKHKDMVGCIEAFLNAIKSGNETEYLQLATVGLDDMIKACTDIRLVSAICKDFLNEHKTFTNLEESKFKLQQQIEELTPLRDIVLDLQVKITDLTSELQLKESKLSEFENYIKSNAANKVDSQELAKLNSEIVRLNVENKILLEDNLKLKDQVPSQDIQTTNLFSEDAKDVLIVSLKEEINKLRSRDWFSDTKALLPLFNNNLVSKCENILYFKEVKPQPYLNTSIAWIDNFLKSGFESKPTAASKGRSYLILVFDSLHNDAVLYKYNKRGWSINSQPGTENRVVITNKLTTSFLLDTLKINAYDCLIVFDRLGYSKNVIEGTTVNKFFLVNTPKDVTDFGLDKNKCIGFFDDKLGRYFKYSISPWTDHLNTEDSLRRTAKCMLDKVFYDILQANDYGGR